MVTNKARSRVLHARIHNSLAQYDTVQLHGQHSAVLMYKSTISSWLLFVLLACMLGESGMNYGTRGLT